MLFDKFSQWMKSLTRDRRAELEAANAECRRLLQLISTQALSPAADKGGHYISPCTIQRTLHCQQDLIRSIREQSRDLTRAELYPELCRALEEASQQLDGFEAGCRALNERYIQSRIPAARQLIGNVEGRPLDNQQMACIVATPENHLVSAGAGTGKTTTILGKVKYLLATGQCTPEEILVLTFTNAAAAEMKNRLRQEVHQDIWVSTFHRLGLFIIRQAEQKAPLVYTGDPSQFAREQVTDLLNDSSYRLKMTHYLLFRNVPEKTEFDFSSGQSYQEYLQSNPPTTLLGETVKSYGEMQIANWLTQYGIEYQYEASYPIDTRTAEYGQYHPDFYLPQYDIYIEYFAIDRKNRVPGYWEGSHGKSASAAYLDGMRWKRKLHQANHTVLIECFAYEHKEGTLLQNLQKQLESRDVPLHPADLESLLEKAGSSSKSLLNGIYELFVTLLALVKSRRCSMEHLEVLCANRLSRSDRILLELFEPVYDRYQAMLQREGAIDFSDMINKAADYVSSGQAVPSCRFVIIDEYQDVSDCQIKLLQALRRRQPFKLMCVGDDWQSIYRFAGSNIGYILNFSQVWGPSQLSRIETTYRFPQKLIDISGSFIMQNPHQMKKAIRSACDSDRNVLEECCGYTEKWAITFLAQRISTLPRNSTVFFIGRYQFDSNALKQNNAFQLSYDNKTRQVIVQLTSRPDLRMYFYTAHKSKGLQADYVCILNNRKDRMGFPSHVPVSPLVSLLLDQSDPYPDAEERRLYYVALTRARRKVFLVTEKENQSAFVEELKDGFAEEFQRGRMSRATSIQNRPQT